MSMVTYYNQAAMYRHQQAVAAQQQFHSGSPMHGWYPGYHPQGGQPAPAASYCMQDEQQQMWHHPHHPHMFHQDFNELVHAGVPMQQHQVGEHDAQLPSPPITVSGSEMSSPGAGGNISPSNTQTRPAPVRSPYEWIKKTSYQTQPNPELERLSSTPSLLDFTAQEHPGKTRTKDKYRVVYTDHQRVELEKEFYYSRYITIRRKAELASNLGLSERQVKIWFQNRRAKERKQVKKREEFAQKDAPVVTLQMQQQQQQQQQHQPLLQTSANQHQAQVANPIAHTLM